MIYIVLSRRPGDSEWKQAVFLQPSKAQAVALFLESDGCEVVRKVEEPCVEAN